MPTSVPMPTKNVGDIFTTSLWNNYLRDNLNKLLNTSHRVVTVAQFAAISGPEGTKGTIAPDEVYLEVDATNGVLWHLAYESGEPTYKWRFLGGPGLVSNVAAFESANFAGAWGDLATVGPSILVPRGGDYRVRFDASATIGVASDTLRAGVAQGAGTPVNVSIYSGSGGFGGQLGSSPTFTALAALAELRLRYSGGAQSNQWSFRVLDVKPVRLI